MYRHLLPYNNCSFQSNTSLTFYSLKHILATFNDPKKAINKSKKSNKPKKKILKRKLKKGLPSNSVVININLP